MFYKWTIRQAGSACVGLLLSSVAFAQSDWLSRGGKDWAPIIFSKSGIGTANAVAEARVTRAAIEGWCGNWSPGDKGCAARQLATPDAKKSYRASADCFAGRITPIDGNKYTYAGVWDKSDIGGGRTKWRDAAGKIVGRDNASGGLSISQQWEVLCPGPLKIGRAQRAAPATKTAPSKISSKFAVGEMIEARFGRDWVRGRVYAIRQVSGGRGPELQYDVRLENGKRGILPARMIRKAVGG